MKDRVLVNDTVLCVPLKTTIYIKPSAASNRLNVFVNPYKLVNTCSACPEQYDVYREDKLVGYLRLRHSKFTARSVNDDVIVYEKIIQDNLEDSMVGAFLSEDQRISELTAAIDFLDNHLLKK